jgi:hypothetical protein
MKPKVRTLRSLHFFRIALLTFALMIFLETLSDIFLNRFLALMSVFMLIPFNLLLIMGINYIEKETIFSNNLLIILSLTPLFLYLGFQPSSITLLEVEGHSSFIWDGIFAIYAEVFILTAVIYTFRLGYETWKNAPLLIKEEAIFFFLGSILIFPISILFYIFSLFDRIFLVFSNFILITGFLIIITTISLEPKLLYILPFSIHRILVKNKFGRPLFDHAWGQSDVNSLIFTGFLNATQKMGQEIIKLGGILDIHLKKGILIIYEAHYTSVGLIASKSSQLLRACLINFSKDFEEKFEKLLKLKIIDQKAYESAYELLERYFSNFSHTIIHNKKQPLILSQNLTLPPQYDSKFKGIFSDLNKYPEISIDIQKSSKSIIPGFLILYKTIQKEISKITDKKQGILKLNSEQEDNL